jgi:hypothetical protein
MGVMTELVIEMEEKCTRKARKQFQVINTLAKNYLSNLALPK